MTQRAEIVEYSSHVPWKCGEHHGRIEGMQAVVRGEEHVFKVIQAPIHCRCPGHCFQSNKLA